ncbi:hypothetical protein Trihar35433_10239 [Trichoderma harzianum]|nr:hypothetical protein Trihar35433_10239 [Trichoderma harzianum]
MHFSSIIYAACTIAAAASHIYDTSLPPSHHPDQQSLSPEDAKQNKEPPTFGGILTNVLTDATSQLEIRILDPNGKTTWNWTANRDLEKGFPHQLGNCTIHNSGRTDAKQSEDGSLIAAIYGDAILAIRYAPDDPKTDKSVTWGICTNTSLLRSSHSLEFLPDNLLAVATSGQSPDDGIVVYNMSLGLSPNPTPIQHIPYLPDAHALVWEEKTQILWAAGMNSSINDKAAASGLINGYLYQPPSSNSLPLQQTPISQHHLPDSSTTYTEWSDNPQFRDEWDAPHDLILIPNQNTFLIPTDLDIHALNMSSGEFISGQQVINTYLKGFSPVDRRSGKNRKGDVEELPRSDIKSVIFGPDGTAVYVQAQWTTFFADKLNFLVKGERKQLDLGGTIYRARHFRMK